MLNLSLVKDGTDTFVVAERDGHKINLLKITENGAIFTYSEDIESKEESALEHIIKTGKFLIVEAPSFNITVRCPRVTYGMFS